MTKHRNYIKECFGSSKVRGQPLSLEELNHLLQELLPQIRARVQVGIGRSNPTLKMLDLLIGSAKIAYGSTDIIETMDSEIADLTERIIELERRGAAPKDTDD